AQLDLRRDCDITAVIGQLLMCLFEHLNHEITAMHAVAKDQGARLMVLRCPPQQIHLRRGIGKGDVKAQLQRNLLQLISEPLQTWRRIDHLVLGKVIFAGRAKGIRRSQRLENYVTEQRKHDSSLIALPMGESSPKGQVRDYQEIHWS